MTKHLNTNFSQFLFTLSVYLVVFGFSGFSLNACHSQLQLSHYELTFDRTDQSLERVAQFQVLTLAPSTKYVSSQHLPFWHYKITALIQESHLKSYLIQNQRIGIRALNFIYFYIQYIHHN